MAVACHPGGPSGETTGITKLFAGLQAAALLNSLLMLLVCAVLFSSVKKLSLEANNSDGPDLSRR